MDVIADFLTILGIPAAFVAAWKAIEEFKSGNAERSRENRHKQAEAARDALRELFTSEKARAAMQMLDWSGRWYKDEGVEHEVRFDDLKPALRITDLSFNPKDRLIRDCFEDFFDRLELIEHQVSIQFLHFGDVSVPIAYYAKKIVNAMSAFEPFLDEYGYPKAKAFIVRAAQ